MPDSTAPRPTRSGPAAGRDAARDAAQNSPAAQPSAGHAAPASARGPRALLRRWWPLLVAVPVGAACGAGYAEVTGPQYQANAYVMVVAQPGGDSSAAVDFAQAYGRVVGQPQIVARAAAGLGQTVAALTSRIEATTSPDAPMIQITGSAPKAKEAAKDANAVADALVAFGNDTGAQTHVKLITFAPAAAPEKPSSPAKVLDVAVGGAAGLLVGGLVLLARPGRANAPVPQPRAETPAAGSGPLPEPFPEAGYAAHAAHAGSAGHAAHAGHVQGGGTDGGNGVKSPARAGA